MRNRAKHIIVPGVLAGLLSVIINQALAHTEKIFYLQGKLGKTAIAVKMLCYDETPAIRYVQYFFSTDKRDRYMAGKMVDGAWRFAADVQENNNYPKPEGSLTLAPAGNNWQGSWTDNAGRKQAILLTPIPDSFSLPPFSRVGQLKEMDPYERYRLESLHFEKKLVRKNSNNLEVTWYLEKESGISFFRLGPGSSGTNTSYVNNGLEAIHLSLVQKYFAYSPQKNYIKPETELLYLTSELVSFRTTATNRLLHLTTTQTQLCATLDVSTGETLKLENLIWLDKATAVPAAGDFFTLYQYRKKVFAPRIFQWLQQLYPYKMKNQNCGINKVDSWNLPAWNLTGKGLALGLNNTDDCGTFQWAVIPYQWLQPFVAKQYHLPVVK